MVVFGETGFLILEKTTWLITLAESSSLVRRLWFSARKSNRFARRPSFRFFVDFSHGSSQGTRSSRNGGSRARGTSAEVLRLLFRQPRGHFLDRRDFSLPVDFLERLFQELEVCHPVLRKMRGNDILAKTFVFHFTCPEDTFLIGEFSVLPVDFLGGFFKART